MAGFFKKNNMTKVVHNTSKRAADLRQKSAALPKMKRTLIFEALENRVLLSADVGIASDDFQPSSVDLESCLLYTSPSPRD